jgi:ABC-type branched-subunit amino acid transport system ATPase component
MVLIVEQRLNKCPQISNRAYVLQSGRGMLNGTAAECETMPPFARLISDCKRQSTGLTGQEERS